MIALGLAGLSILLASRYLVISTNQNKLFSSHVPFFHRYLTFIHEFPENEAAYVVLQARHPAHPPAARRWIDAARAITRRLAKLSAAVISVDSHVSRRELGDQALLFASWKQVRRAAAYQQRFAPLAKIWGTRPALAGALLGPTRIERFLRGVALRKPDAPTAAFVRTLCQSWNAAISSEPRHWFMGREIPNLHSLASPAAPTPASRGYYYFTPRNHPHDHLLLIKVYPRFHFDSLAAVSAPLEKIRKVVAAAAAPFHAQFRVGLTGRPVLAADEMRITTHDTDWAEALAMLVVLAGLILMLRSVRLALAAGLTLAIAIAWTFGYATLVVGQLNLLSTVFVIALIGIGMDYLIQILVRYRREVRCYERDSAVWARVFRYVSPPILTACAGAAGAFLVARFTHFRGDAELGIIAGGGLLLCLLAGYTVLPALLVSFPPRLKMVDAGRRYSDDRPPPRAGWRNFIGLIVWIGLLLALLPLMLRIRFNPNLLDLQARGLQSVRLVRKIPTWEAVVLSHSPAYLASIERWLRTASHAKGRRVSPPTMNQDKGGLKGRPPRDASPIRSVRSLLNAQAKQRFLADHAGSLARVRWRSPAPVTKRDLAGIAGATAALARIFSKVEIRRPTAPNQPFASAARQLWRFTAMIRHADPVQRQQIAFRLTLWQRRFMKQLQKMARMMVPPPLNISRLPSSIRNHFLSRNGVYALYITPRYNLWRQANLRAFVQCLEGTGARPGLVPAGADLTGIAVQLYHSTQAIRYAFIKTTIMALVLVVLLVFLDLRRLGQTLLTISVLALGLPMLVGVMGLLHMQWNFANFFAMPILIGAGHEYGVFMVHRYREARHNPRRVWRFWDVSERALLLCAFVTCSSFGFLSLARDRGIASLGLVMAIGIGCIYLSAAFVVRPLLTWRLARKGVYRYSAPRGLPEK